MGSKLLNNKYPHTKKYGIALSSLFTSFLIIFIILSSLGNADFSFFRQFGDVFLLIALSVSNFLVVFYILKEKSIPKIFLGFLIFTTFYSLLCIIGIYNTPTSRGLITLFQFISVINFTFFMSLIRWTGNKFKWISRLVTFYIVINVLIWVVTGFPRPFSSLFTNPNVFAPYIFYLMFFVISFHYYRKKKLTFVFLMISSLLLILYADARSVYIAILVSVFTYVFWKIITRNNIFFHLYFFFITFLIMIFTFVYPNITSFDNFYYFENLAREYTGKSLASGRDDIWAEIIFFINQNPIFGYGPGTLPSDLFYNDSSSHNLYLQTALESGYIGLILLLFVLLIVWRMFWRGRHDKIVKLSASFFIATLIHQTFELSLIQNQLSIGLLQWLVISVGISRSIYINKESAI